LSYSTALLAGIQSVPFKQILREENACDGWLAEFEATHRTPF